MAAGDQTFAIALDAAHHGWRLDRALAAAVPTLSRERPLTLGRAIQDRAFDQRDDIAIVLPPERVTYGELCDRVDAAARALIALGVGQGDRVALMMPNCTEFIEAFFAVTTIGAIAVPLNTRYEAVELAYVLEHSGACLLLTVDGSPERIDFEHRGSEAVALLSGSAVPVLLLDRPDSNGAFANLGASVQSAEVRGWAAAVDARTAAMIMYTSGTTAKPKGCVVSHEALLRTGTARFTERSSQPDTAVWTPCPLFHTGALLPSSAASRWVLRTSLHGVSTWRRRSGFFKTNGSVRRCHSFRRSPTR